MFILDLVKEGVKEGLLNLLQYICVNVEAKKGFEKHYNILINGIIKSIKTKY